MDWVAWLTQASPAVIINGLGLGSLAILFASDRIQTRGRSIRELAARDAAHDKLIAEKDRTHAVVVAAIVASHVEQLKVRDDRNGELKASLAGMEIARNLERERAHEATSMLGKAINVVEVSNHLLESLGETAKDGGA